MTEPEFTYLSSRVSSFGVWALTHYQSRTGISSSFLLRQETFPQLFLLDENEVQTRPLHIGADVDRLPESRVSPSALCAALTGYFALPLKTLQICSRLSTLPFAWPGKLLLQAPRATPPPRCRADGRAVRASTGCPPVSRRLLSLDCGLPKDKNRVCSGRQPHQAEKLNETRLTTDITERKFISCLSLANNFEGKIPINT